VPSDKARKLTRTAQLFLGDVMKITTGLLAGAAVLAMAQTAHAAPKVAGKYILMSFTQCQAMVSTTMGSYERSNGTDGPAVASVNLPDDGEINIAVGSIDFQVPAAGASTGTASLEMSIVAGASVRINAPNGNIGTHTENVSGTSTVTDTTFTFDPDDGPAMTWTMRAGDFKTASVNGVARTMYLTRRESAKCISAVTATKQLP
jgi:hypothetical protein